MSKLKWFVLVLFLGFTVKLVLAQVSETIDRKWWIENNRMIINETSSALQNLSLEEVLFQKRSEEADKNATMAYKIAYEENYNKTIAEYDEKIAEYTAALSNMTIPK